MIVYHGSPHLFSAFEHRPSRDRVPPTPHGNLYFTNNPKTAVDYSMVSGKDTGYLYWVWLPEDAEGFKVMGGDTWYIVKDPASAVILSVRETHRSEIPPSTPDPDYDFN